MAELARHQSTLLVQPTGTGKTVVIAHVIRRWPGRVLFVAHREELVRQAAGTIEAVTGDKCDIEMGCEHADLSPIFKAKVVVASKDSLHPDRLAKWRGSEFSLVITDEAHHAIGKSYRRIYSHLPTAKHLGVTDTPDRLDERALGQVFASVAADYEISDAINDGWLVPILQRSVHVEALDFSNVKTTAGDLNQKQLAEIMEQERMLHEVLTPTLEIAGSRKTLMFTTSVTHAARAAEILNRHKPNSARWVCGETPKDERRQTLLDYKAGAFQYLCNVGCFTEGFDEPSIEVVAVARPTKSRSLYAQMVGRGTRPLGGVVDTVALASGRREAIRLSGKPSLEVIDFEGNAGRHKLITTADILGGRYDEEVLHAVRQRTSKSATPVDTLGLLRDTAKQLHDEAAARKRDAIKAAVDYSTTTVNPFDVLDLEPVREREWERGVPATEAQRALLSKFGVDATGVSKSRAGQLIAECKDRRQHGQCSYQQARVLRGMGISTAGVTFEQARRLISENISKKFKGAA
jgi:superfamily II DNA or RNA helicase